MKKQFTTLLFICLFAILHGQEFPQNYFRAPLDIPLYLSGNFGELRSNHYHSGIDIKTQGRTGLRVYASAEGFVSRIKVSPFGYGLAIYVAHPNGYTTVYGHLQEFAPKIARIAKQLQYAKESFAIDEAIAPNLLPLEKGELIAFSGNSGSSGGPHLHFEIRETKTEFPTNPLLYGFPIRDNVVPIIRSLFLYPLDANAKVDGGIHRKKYELNKEGNIYSIVKDVIPLVAGNIGLAIDARDYMTATRNYYGIYKAKIYVDKELKHSFVFDKFSFGESRYINAHIDYELYKTKKIRVHKLFHEKNQRESFADRISLGLSFQDQLKHEVRVEISDASGNSTDLKFHVQSTKTRKSEKLLVQVFNCEKRNELRTSNFFAEMPAFSFYKDVRKKKLEAFACERKESYSDSYHFLDETVPLHEKITVGIVPKQIPVELKDKAFVARKNANRYYFIGKKWQNEFLTGKTNKIGDFVILVDTIAPQITLWKGASYRKTGKLRYKITDDLSGIVAYRGLIDGKWVLFEYDAKRNLLWHKLSKAKKTSTIKHELLLKVTDACGNVAERKASFSW